MKKKTMHEINFVLFILFLLLLCLQVYLHAEESWAETAAHSHWLVKSSWWRPKKLVVEEVMGTKRRSGLAKMIDNGKGVLWIRGKFKDHLPNPYFKLTLTSHVTEEDFQLGYSMSGHLERSFEKYISFQITHLAFVRRRDYFQDPNSDPNKSKPEVHQLTSFLTGSKSSNTAGPSGSNTGSSSLTSQSKTARFVKNLCRVYLSSK